MVGWIVTLVVGAFIGWIASLIMDTDSEQGALWNIVIGILGAALGSWLFGSVLGIGSATAATANAVSLPGILWGILGAVVLVGLLKAVRVLR